MTTTWVLVAHRAGARIFENRGPGKGLTLLREVSNEAGRLHNRDVDADRPGRAFDRVGGQRHGMSREDVPHDQAARTFARELGQMLHQGRTGHRYDRLVLAAEPRFLGMIRRSLDPPTTARIRATLGKDLGHVDETGLPNHLGEVMAL